MPARLLQDERQGRSRAGPALFIFCRRSRAMRWRCGMSTAGCAFPQPYSSPFCMRVSACGFREWPHQAHAASLPMLCESPVSALLSAPAHSCTLHCPRSGLVPQIARNGACGSVRCRRRWLYCAVRVRGMAVRPVIGRCAAGIKQRSRPFGAASSFYVMRFEPLSGYNGFWSAEVI